MLASDTIPRSQSWGRAPVLICPNAAFGPTRTKIMGDAFECAIALFKVAPSQMVREAMANRIIAAAHHGVRDMDQLVDAALVGTGLTRLGGPAPDNTAVMRASRG